MECNLRQLGERLCVTSVYLDEKLCGVEVPFRIDYGTLPHKLPFLIWDLVKLEGLVFDEPVYGVWCNAPLDREYNRMGRFKTDEERVILYEDEDYPYTVDRMDCGRLADAW